MYFASLYHLKRMQQTKESTVSASQAPVWWPSLLERFVAGVKDLLVSVRPKRQPAYFQQAVLRAPSVEKRDQLADQVTAERLSALHLPLSRPTVLTCLPVPGDLGPRNYLDLIAKAQAIYQRGERVLLLDMGAVAALGASGLFALYNIARIFHGLAPQDPDTGWSALSELANDEQMQTQPRVKLLHVQPAVGQVLSSAGYSAWLQEDR